MFLAHKSFSQLAFPTSSRTKGAILELLRNAGHKTVTFYKLEAALNLNTKTFCIAKKLWQTTQLSDAHYTSLFFENRRDLSMYTVNLISPPHVSTNLPLLPPVSLSEFSHLSLPPWSLVSAAR